MPSYNSVYQLHVPRTGGIFIKNHLINQFNNKNIYASHRQQLDNNRLTESYFVSGHFGKYPIDFMDKPVVFSIIRNPVDRYISYYKYVKHMFPEYKNNDLLDYWLNDPIISRLHSNTCLKNFTGKINHIKYNQYFVTRETAEQNWFIDEYSNNVEDGFSFIDKNYIFLFEDIKKVTTCLSNLLNIAPFPNLYKYNSSDKSDLGITKQQYAKIEELNKKDMELYEYARIKEKEYSILYN